MKSKSHFLFGPRGVGKTTLIRDTLSQNYQIISLLRSEDRIRLIEQPSHLRRMIDSKKSGRVVLSVFQLKRFCLQFQMGSLIEGLTTESSTQRLTTEGVRKIVPSLRFSETI